MGTNIIEIDEILLIVKFYFYDKTVGGKSPITDPK